MAFPATRLAVLVELLLDGVWTDISSRIRIADGGTIGITRGLPDESTRADASKTDLVINNADGVFSPRNPLSPYYGLIGRNTPIRISAEGSVRFTGEVSAWPQRWDVTGRDVWVPITAQGVLRRLGQGASPLGSAMYRGLTNPALSVPPVAYWPCEDGEDATALGSAVGGLPMKFSGTPSLAQFDGFACSSPIPLLSDSEWSGIVPTHALTDAVQVRFLLHIPADSAPGNGQTILRLRTSGSAHLWHVDYGTGGALALRGYGEDGGLLDSGYQASFAVLGKLLRVSVELQRSGSNIAVALRTIEPGAAVATSWTGTVTAQTAGQATRVIVSPDGGIDQAAIGHISVHSQVTDFTAMANQLAAYAGERAGRRIQRLCTEEGIAFTSMGDLDATPVMGPQRPATLQDLLGQAADADMGLLYEPRDALGLAYRTRASLYNQAAALALDYAAGHLVPPLEPVDDDQATRNDITVTREGGSSARAVLETGPLSVQAPPDGVGRYDDSVTLTVRHDAQLPDLAGWRLHLGTVDEARYPLLALNLGAAAVAADPALRAGIVALDVGHRITIDHMPAWMPPGQVAQLARGYTETLRSDTWKIEVNCTPASPYDVAVYGTARYGTAGSQLAAAATAGATTLTVTTSRGPRWTTDPAHFPFDILVGGERMTVTGITGTGGSGSDVVENWEDTSYNVTWSGTWARSSASAHGGSWSLKSAAVGHGQTSDAVVTVPSGVTSVRFWYRVSSEEGFDFFRFSIDGDLQFRESGFVGWTQSDSYPVVPGQQLRFRYSKDSSVSAGEDAAYIDDLAFSGSGAAGQTFTVVRGVNGITKAHSAGEPVVLAKPAVRAL